MEQFTKLTAKMVSIPTENVDTDQIIPARFLKVTDKNGLGDNLFFDWRYNADGSPKEDFILNTEQGHQAKILVAGDNFGCGSSREHAPWAIMGYGFQAVVSTSFADIFRNNSLKLGLLPVIVDKETHHQLMSLIEEEPETEIFIDLANQTLQLPDGRKVKFPIDNFSKNCILNGVDQLGYLQQHTSAVESYESVHPDRVNTVAA
ncbi:MAG: 3-isopropylmalate dehydratase small subunit [Anaerolineaceae bacterium]|nr:3-isopropylmalate dehydratase small subunit [Anaerolineaceae bacterium]MCB9101369.1 3-isopropylmalate dehydratase small subunit [Anaerolineales bacterium]